MAGHKIDVASKNQWICSTPNVYDWKGAAFDQKRAYLKSLEEKNGGKACRNTGHWWKDNLECEELVQQKKQKRNSQQIRMRITNDSGNQRSLDPVVFQNWSCTCLYATLTQNFMKGTQRPLGELKMPSSWQIFWIFLSSSQCQMIGRH